MVLTLFISEDKRDEFARTAWPFDSLLEHTNRGGFSSDMYVGLSPECHPSQPDPGAPAHLLHLPGQGDSPLPGGLGLWPLLGSSSEGAVP